MINAYPITAVNSYRTHQDYYRISAVRRITGSQAAAARQQPPLPFDRSAFKQQSAPAAYSDATDSGGAEKPLQQPYLTSRLQAYSPAAMKGRLLDLRV